MIWALVDMLGITPKSKMIDGIWPSIDIVKLIEITERIR